MLCDSKGRECCFQIVATIVGGAELHISFNDFCIVGFLVFVFVKSWLDLAGESILASIWIFVYLVSPLDGSPYISRASVTAGLSRLHAPDGPRRGCGRVEVAIDLVYETREPY